MPISGQCIGNINIDVYETSNGETFFYMEGSNPNLIPMLDYVENSLEKY